VEVAFIDRDNNKGSTAFYLPATTLLADAITAAGQYATLVAAISDATYEGYSISTGAHESAQAQPPETADVERKGVFTFTDSAGFSSIMSVPSIKNTVVIDGTNKIDDADTNVTAFVAGVVTGAGLAARAISYHGVSFASVRRSKKSHRKSSKG
jgi:hypothetical protein